MPESGRHRYRRRSRSGWLAGAVAIRQRSLPRPISGSPTARRCGRSSRFFARGRTPMAHSSPELRQSGAADGGEGLYRWGLLAAAMGLGVGMGMAATGATVPGVAVAGASAALCIASVLAGRGAHGSRAKDVTDPCAGPEYVDE